MLHRYIKKKEERRKEGRKERGKEERKRRTEEGQGTKIEGQKGRKAGKKEKNTPDLIYFKEISLKVRKRAAGEAEVERRIFDCL